MLWCHKRVAVRVGSFLNLHHQAWIFIIKMKNQKLQGWIVHFTGNGALRVAKPKRHETLESTWKTITEGRSLPLARHLKKSDTWDTDLRSDGQDPIPVMKKSETMNDRMAPSPSPSPGSGKLLRKESSLSQDELNRRVEAFIKKFNEEMRLQRQKSLQNYMEMVNHGTHQIDGVWIPLFSSSQSY